MHADGRVVYNVNQHLERLDGLARLIQGSAKELITRCEKQTGKVLLVTQGWRSLADQMLIYQRGRTLNRQTHVWEISEPSQVVTRAKPGTSAHNVITKAGAPSSMALDVIPYKADGTIDWNVSDEFWDEVYNIAWRVGLDPLGDPIGSYLAGDKGHFEEPAWKLKLEGLGLVQPVEV